ncbi:MAG: GNAT family N-acetyltransferase [Salinivirgaceae bacterium]|nr:GNAT family N-acetyltransferase [Salinivirgaceae bacterium]
MYIYPLLKDELALLLASYKDFATVNNLNCDEFKIDEETTKAIKEDLIPKLEVANYNWCFSTMWLMVEKQSKTIVGSFCFYGEPNENMEVEIGYGVSPKFQNHGYMSEALNAIVEWCRSSNNIKYILAHCNIDNLDSNRILEKCNFTLAEQNTELNLWKITP